jgi:hypothetical protein
VVANLDYALPNPSCYPPPADAGADASSSLVERPAAPIGPPPTFCDIVAPDGGASGMITEVVLQPNSDAAPLPGSIPNAYCQFSPGPAVAWPTGCLLTTLENEFCVADCSACP